MKYLHGAYALAAAAAISLAACNSGGGATSPFIPSSGGAPAGATTPKPSASPTSSASGTPAPTSTPVTTPTPGSTPTPADTPTPAATSTPVSTPTPAATSTPVSTPTPAPTSTPVATPTPVVLTTADQNVQPTFTCVAYVPATGRYYLRFGYSSTEATGVIIPIDSLDGATQLNQVIVTPADGSAPYEWTGQPTLFVPGSAADAIDVPVNQKDHVTWYLDGNSSTQTTNGAPNCP
jgi:hypothetical protein